MKKDLLFGVLVLFQVYVFGQSFKEGVYENRKSCVTVCIHKDTLLYYHKSNVATLYYGYASIVDDKLSLGNNLALGLNARVATCRNDSRFVEIELYELYKDIIFGERLPNMAPHHIKSNLFTLHFNDKIKIIDDTIVKLSVQEFYPSVGEVKMTNLEKYNNAFMETFEITEDQLAGLKYQDIEAWDSVGHMTLVAALEDAFDIMMDTDDIIDFSSYEKGKELLAKADYGVKI